MITFIAIDVCKLMLTNFILLFIIMYLQYFAKLKKMYLKFVCVLFIYVRID